MLRLKLVISHRVANIHVLVRVSVLSKWHLLGRPLCLLIAVVASIMKKRVDTTTIKLLNSTILCDQKLSCLHGWILALRYRVLAYPEPFRGWTAVWAHRLVWRCALLINANIIVAAVVQLTWWRIMAYSTTGPFSASTASTRHETGTHEVLLLEHLRCATRCVCLRQVALLRQNGLLTW